MVSDLSYCLTSSVGFLTQLFSPSIATRQKQISMHNRILKTCEISGSDVCKCGMVQHKMLMHKKNTFLHFGP